ncbi:TRMT2B [Symbiodinium sp. CCMP2592]|nr:TRMT2B [Symbiodinium sp. CCMP2592]
MHAALVCGGCLDAWQCGFATGVGLWISNESRQVKLPGLQPRFHVRRGSGLIIGCASLLQPAGLLLKASLQVPNIEVAAFVEKSSFPIYDRKARCGVWRTVLSRVNPGGDMLVMVQTTTIKEEDRSAFVDPLVAELVASGLGICAIYHLHNDEVTDAPRPNALVTSLHGMPRLEMPMLELKLEIGPLSFFNPNTTTCRFLMETAIRYLKLRKSDILLDIFCGIGTIGLCAAGYCAKVIGIDIVQENIEDARRNAQQNSILNTEFIVGKAEEVVPKILGDMDTSLEVVAVVDPSRAGPATSGFDGSVSGLPRSGCWFERDHQAPYPRLLAQATVFIVSLVHNMALGASQTNSRSMPPRQNPD